MTVFLLDAPENGATFVDSHSSELMILLLSAMVMVTLLVLVPRLLSAHHQALQMQHAEHMRALEQGQPAPRVDERSRAAGRTASLVPMVVICAAGTVTCFLAAYRNDNLFSLTLAVWSVAGVVCLAAITGSLALMGRLAQLDAGDEDDEEAAEAPADKTV